MCACLSEQNVKLTDIQYLFGPSSKQKLNVRVASSSKNSAAKASHHTLSASWREKKNSRLSRLEQNTKQLLEANSISFFVLNFRLYFCNKEINILNGIKSKMQKILNGLILRHFFNKLLFNVLQFQSNCTLNCKHSLHWYEVWVIKGLNFQRKNNRNVRRNQWEKNFGWSFNRRFELPQAWKLILDITCT